MYALFWLQQRFGDNVEDETDNPRERVRKTCSGVTIFKATRPCVNHITDVKMIFLSSGRSSAVDSFFFFCSIPKQPKGRDDEAKSQDFSN